MSLRQRQSQFALAVAHLVLHAAEMGYEVTHGDAYRDPRVHGEVGEKKAYGHPSSQHKKRLAIDLNLFKDGKYLPNTDDHEPLGEWWEKTYGYQGARWGGRFRDGNHYEFKDHAGPA